jgi:RNA polymerase-binding transcription factor DksA
LLSVFLFSPARTEQPMPDLAATRLRLQASLDELEARLANVARDLSELPSADWNEMAVEQEDDEALEHQGALIESEIASVRRALSRIADGSFGQCVRCGAQIAPDRLEARPEAALCIDCARLEK